MPNPVSFINICMFSSELFNLISICPFSVNFIEFDIILSIIFSNFSTSTYVYSFVKSVLKFMSNSFFFIYEDDIDTIFFTRSYILHFE